MPKRGYRHLSLREELYKQLENLKEKHGFGSISDVIAYLLALNEEREVYKKLENLLERMNSIVESLEATLSAKGWGKIEEEFSIINVRLNMLSRKVKELEDAVRRIGRR